MIYILILDFKIWIYSEVHLESKCPHGGPEWRKQTSELTTFTVFPSSGALDIYSGILRSKVLVMETSLINVILINFKKN